MSRSEQAPPEAPSDLEINLSLLWLAVEERAHALRQRLQTGYYRTGTYLEVKANVIMPHLTFEQIPTAIPATLNYPLPPHPLGSVHDLLYPERGSKYKSDEGAVLRLLT